MFYGLSKRIKHSSSNSRTKEMFYDVWQKSNFVKHRPTSSNIVKHGVQTNQTCFIQQCWMMFYGDVFITRLDGPLYSKYILSRAKRRWRPNSDKICTLRFDKYVEASLSRKCKTPWKSDHWFVDRFRRLGDTALTASYLRRGTFKPSLEQDIERPNWPVTRETKCNYGRFIYLTTRSKLLCRQMF